jgi:hypothetical protein
MKAKDKMFDLEKFIALCLVMLLAAPFSSAATSSRPPASTATDAKAQGSESAATEYPDSPGALWQASQQQAATPQSAPDQQQPAASQPTPAQPQESIPAQSAPAGQQNTAPVGTAAAPYVKADGVTAARPTGAAIAPGKQKRSHSLALKVGLIVGGAIAIGTVTALSLGSSSKP